MFTGTLAANYSDSLASLPLSCVQPKYDGIRVQICASRLASNAVDRRHGHTVNTKTCTRSGGYVPNEYIRALLALLPEGCDGELMAADNESGEAQFSKSMSTVSAKHGQLEFKYVVYDFNDYHTLTMSYEDRMGYVFWKCVQSFGSLDKMPAWLQFAPTHVRCNKPHELQLEVDRLVGLGHEGAIVRRLDLVHVEGRSTRKLASVLRIKAWAQAEFVISDVVEEKYHNCLRNRTNYPNLIGTGKGFASSFVCKPGVDNGFTESFRAPLSVDDATAKQYWERKDEIIGTVCTVRWLAAGCVNKPRMPVCLGLRFEFDLG